MKPFLINLEFEWASPSSKWFGGRRRWWLSAGLTREFGTSRWALYAPWFRVFGFAVRATVIFDKPLTSPPSCRVTVEVDGK